MASTTERSEQNMDLAFLSQTKYSNLFGSNDDQKNLIRLESFDWERLKINTRYIIFIAGRCGSTWLTHLLEDSHLCGAPHEFFNESSLLFFNKFIQASSFSEYFLRCVKDYSRGRKFGFQVDETRLRDLLFLINFGAIFPKKNSQFFWMYRRNIWNQAYSFARAKATGYWHKYSDYTIGDPNSKISISHGDIWAELLAIIEQEQSMFRFFVEYGIDPIHIEYEVMVEDPAFVVIQVLQNLGCRPNRINNYLKTMASKTLKIEAENKSEIFLEFQENFAALLNKVVRERMNVNVHQIQQELKSEYGLDIFSRA